MGMTTIAIDRYRDVIDTELARAETFLSLIDPAAKILEALAGTIEDLPGARRSGWSFDSLLPYLLRDWTNTSEL